MADNNFNARIYRSVKRLAPNGTELEQTTIEISGDTLDNCRKHFDELEGNK